MISRGKLDSAAIEGGVGNGVARIIAAGDGEGRSGHVDWQRRKGQQQHLGLEVSVGGGGGGGGG